MGETESQEARDARVAWYREAKFGLFIHWGLYAIPAGRWKGEPIAGIGEWIQNRAKIPVAEYAALAPRFNPVKFDAEEWVTLARDAGMKYVVITSKHHDGFALFRTQVSPFNIVDGTPFKRDVLQELASACQKHGMRLGFYYSQSQDWHHPGGAASGGTWDAAQEGDFDDYLQRIAEPQVREILTGYGPVCLIWFDTPMQMTDERAGRFVRLVRGLQPECLINGRLRADRSGVDYSSMGDNRIPPEVVPGVWETPATLNDTWGFKSDDENWKPASELIFKLVDIVSKGGNYLLNVGPTAEGIIPAASVERLREVGRWLKVNGEAIYGAGPTPFGAEFGAPTTAQEHGREVTVSGNRAWRCTAQPGRLYFHLFEWPGAEFVTPAVSGTVIRAYLLGDASRGSLAVIQEEGGVRVRLPEVAAGTAVLCLETR
jgi:alpha-L-fucosidase